MLKLDGSLFKSSSNPKANQYYIGFLRPSLLLLVKRVTGYLSFFDSTLSQKVVFFVCVNNDSTGVFDSDLFAFSSKWWVISIQRLDCTINADNDWS